MSLTDRKHLGKQEEAIEETGLQIRESDPSSPVENQVWLNTTSQKIKLRQGTDNVTLFEGGIGDALEVPPSGILDFAVSRSYFKSVDENILIESLANITKGEICHLSIINTNFDIEQETSITAVDPSLIADSDYFILNAANNTSSYYFWYDFDGAGNDPLLDGTSVPIEITAGLQERTRFTTPTSTPVTGSYFKIYSANDVTSYKIWYNVDDGGLQPAANGDVLVQVAITGGDSRQDIALKTSNAINALADFTSFDDGVDFVVENVAIGVTTDAHEGSTPVANGFSITVEVQGKDSNTAEEVAQFTASAIDLLADFNAPYTSGLSFTVTNADAGFTDNPINEVSGGFSVIVSVSGTGQINADFGFGFAISQNENLIVNAQTHKLFTIIPTLNQVLVSTKAYAL